MKTTTPGAPEARVILPVLVGHGIAPADIGGQLGGQEGFAYRRVPVEDTELADGDVRIPEPLNGAGRTVSMSITSGLPAEAGVWACAHCGAGRGPVSPGLPHTSQYSPQSSALPPR